MTSADIPPVAGTDVTGQLPVDTPRPKPGRSVRSAAGPIAAVLLLAVGWELLGRAWNFLYLPPLSEVLVALWDLITDGTIARELAASLTALGAGMVIAIGLGVLIGTVMGLSATARATLDVYVDAMMAAPTVAFVPLFILLFGLGFPTRVATVVLFAIFPLIINTQAGVRAAQPDLVEMGRSLGASKAQMFRELRLPMAYPHLLAGLRIGVARGVDGMMTGEVLIAAVGLGGLLGRFGNAFTMDYLYAVVLVLLAMVLLAERLVVVLGWLLVPFARRPSSLRAGA
jgi:NitT/TauT family transport system permease protein